MLAGCKDTSVEPVEISGLFFSRNEFKWEPYDGYQNGVPLILDAFTDESYEPKSVMLDVYTKRDRIRVRMYSYHDMPSELFIEAFYDVEGYGLLVVKEANVRVAYDRELGRYTTSQATVNRIIDLINRLDGIILDEQLAGLPVLTFYIQQEADPKILDVLRDNKNVQIIEPGSVPVFFTNQPNKKERYKRFSKNQVLTALKATIFTIQEGRNFLATQSGDTVWAEYIQPNGDTLTTNTVIK